MTDSYKSPVISCLECRHVTSAKGIFSHIISAHTDEGKSRMISASKASKANHTKQKAKAEQLRIYYYASPNVCVCGTAKTYEKRNNKYCSSSCAATINNRNRDSSIKTGPQKFVGPKQPKQLNYTKISFCKVCSKCFQGDRKTCSTECYTKLLSDRAKSNPSLGGNKNNRAWGWYVSKFAGNVWLESSYEHKIAVELDSNNIVWTRPKHITYDNKKYFPDFYLIEYDIYLDPKNDYLIGIDLEKISRVMEQNDVVIHILNKNQLSWKYIQTLI